MPSLARVQITHPLFSTTSEQHMTNTLYFSDSAGVSNVIDAPVTNAAIIDIPLKVLAAYNTLALALSGNAVNPGNLKIYDMFDPQPRVAVYDASFSPTHASGAPLPSEVALCLSYRTNYVAGVNKARKRGRIFLGPLVTAGMTSTTSATPTRPSTAFWTPKLQAFHDVLQDNVTYADCNWVQYSPTTSLFGFVSECWYDTAFDTQRARGCPPDDRVELTP